MCKKALITITVCLSIILMNENSFAESSSKSKFIRAEGSLLIGLLHKRIYAYGIEEFVYYNDFSGMLIGGIFLGNILGLEASIFHIFDYWMYRTGGKSIYSANISLNIPFKKRFSLFITAGVGGGRYDVNANIGGGVKIKLKDKWSIRVEYRDWRGLDEGDPGGSILCGASYFF